MLSCKTASIGAALALKDGVTRLWPVGIQCGISLTVVSLILSALMNRFFRTRFCLGTCISVSLFQVVSFFIASSVKTGLHHHHGFEVLSIVPFFAVMFLCCIAFIAMTAALSVRVKPSVTAGCVSAAVVLSFLSVPLESKMPFLATLLAAVLPNTGRFWMPDTSEVLNLSMSAIAITVFWMTIGCALIRGKEIS
jgi:hypothetical protein